MENGRFANDVLYQLKLLKDKICRYKDNRDYIYANIFENWVKQFNDIVLLCNREQGYRLNIHKVNEWDLSSTQKTIRSDAVEDLLAEIELLIQRFTNELDTIRFKEREQSVPCHQMRKCFKTGMDGCAVNPPLDANKVFIAMPFDDRYRDSYEYGIKMALDNIGLRYFRADSEISNVDIMCKVCREIQSCKMAIINISGLNPNVMLELGLAYGIGKPVMIIKDKDTRSITDIGSVEYIEYSHAYDLMTKIMKKLQ